MSCSISPADLVIMDTVTAMPSVFWFPDLSSASGFSSVLMTSAPPSPLSVTRAALSTNVQWPRYMRRMALPSGLYPAGSGLFALSGLQPAMFPSGSATESLIPCATQFVPNLALHCA